MVAACPFPCRRGTPIRIQRLAETIARSGRKVHVASYHYGEDVDSSVFSSDDGGGKGYELHRIPKVPGKWDPAPGPGLGKTLVLNPLLLAKTANVIRRYKLRLLHCHHYEALLIGLTLRKIFPLKIVYDAHTLLGAELAYYTSSIFEAPINRFGGFLDRTLPKRADHVIPVTEEIHDTLASYSDAADGERGKMTIVGNGIEKAALASFHRQVGDVHRGRIVYAGNLAAYQGIELLLEAFAIVAAQNTDAHLALVSQKPHEPVLEMARAFGVADKVTFLDSAEADLSQELCSADILVNPRIKCPGYPLKLLNYMAAGRPIISFRSSGKNLTDGIDASLVRDGNVTEFAGAILTLLSNPTLGDRIGAAARETVFLHYSWEAIAKRVDAAYDKAMKALPEFAGQSQL
ncbi:MAG: glycosyltransferase family 4 protein [Pseudomonadota bacterium]